MGDRWMGPFAPQMETRPLGLEGPRAQRAAGEEALFAGLRRLCEEGPWIYAALWLNRSAAVPVASAGEAIGTRSLLSPSQPYGKLVCSLLYTKQQTDPSGGAVDYAALALAMAELRRLEFEQGEGILGEAAVSQTGDWWLSTSPSGYRVRPAILLGGSDKGDDHWRAQFAAGLETVLLASVQGGILQLGSTEKLQEEPSIPKTVRRLFAPYLAAVLPPSVISPIPTSFPATSSFATSSFATSAAEQPNPSFARPTYFQTLDPPAPSTRVWSEVGQLSAVRHANPFAPKAHSTKAPWVNTGVPLFARGSPQLLPVPKPAATLIRQVSLPPTTLSPGAGATRSPPFAWEAGLSSLGTSTGGNYQPGPRTDPQEASPGNPTAFPSVFNSQPVASPPGSTANLLDLEQPGRPARWAVDLDTAVVGPRSTEAFFQREIVPGLSNTRAWDRLANGVNERVSADGQAGAVGSGAGWVNLVGVPNPQLATRSEELLARWSGAPSSSSQGSLGGVFNTLGNVNGDDRSLSLGVGTSSDASEGRLPLTGGNLWANSSPGNSWTRSGTLELFPSDSGEGGSGRGLATGAAGETPADRGSREEAYRLQEDFLKLQGQLDWRRPALSLLSSPGVGPSTFEPPPSVLPDDELASALRREAVAQEVRFAWTPDILDERGQQRHSPNLAGGWPKRPEGTGYGYEEIFVPRGGVAGRDSEAVEAGARVLPPSPFLGPRDATGGDAEQSGGSERGVLFGRGWPSELGGWPRVPMEMEPIVENEPVAMRPWDKGRQTWYSNLEALRGLVPDTAQVKLEDLLDRVAKHIVEMRTRIAARGITVPRELFRPHVDSPWRISPEKNLIVEELGTDNLMLVEAFVQTEDCVPQIAKALCIKGRELLYTRIEAVGPNTRARFILKVIGETGKEDLVSNFVQR